MTDLNVSITKNISAPIEKVFDAWLDPTILTQFILPAPGMPQPEVENDAREGGRFRRHRFEFASTGHLECLHPHHDRADQYCVE